GFPDVNVQASWITEGHFASYLFALVRTTTSHYGMDRMSESGMTSGNTLHLSLIITCIFKLSSYIPLGKHLLERDLDGPAHVQLQTLTYKNNGIMCFWKTQKQVNWTKGVKIFSSVIISCALLHNLLLNLDDSYQLLPNDPLCPELYSRTRHHETQ
ncbi:hypothetical protein GN958_ATG00094, partial [Phytophthora infestans]